MHAEGQRVQKVASLLGRPDGGESEAPSLAGRDAGGLQRAVQREELAAIAICGSDLLR